eukprot:TRINITY_DN12094_c0_g1_i1.p1 TRINITY_DN12094_c0_g1~~TRINITY_DN12094_c0_g1_i1.p1  ORF type:complete len:442 (+),score=72.30 TRINITY_DN12094_c0_g1_i1:113-1327(+)
MVQGMAFPVYLVVRRLTPSRQALCWRPREASGQSNQKNDVEVPACPASAPSCPVSTFEQISAKVLSSPTSPPNCLANTSEQISAKVLSSPTSAPSCLANTSEQISAKASATPSDAGLTTSADVAESVPASAERRRRPASAMDGPTAEDLTPPRRFRRRLRRSMIPSSPPTPASPAFEVVIERPVADGRRWRRSEGPSRGSLTHGPMRGRRRRWLRFKRRGQQAKVATSGAHSSCFSSEVAIVVAAEERGPSTEAEESTDSSSAANEVIFFPDAGRGGVERILALLDGCHAELDVAMFIFSDSRLSNAVRMIVDDKQLNVLSAVAFALAKAGVDVRHDGLSSHMHHKFAVLDGERVITGSYNWTVRASRNNHEHVVIIHDQASARMFQQEFEKLWIKFEKNPLPQ